MSKNPMLIVAALLGAVGAAQAAASSPAVNLDGSVGARAAKGPSLAASANAALARDKVPSAGNPPQDVKAAADADLRKRGAAPHLHAERQNLTGPAAARVQAQQQTPATLDHDMAMGDKDHTEQVTNLKVYLKK